MPYTAKKRRYSSTAVGFPIRIDQKPHSERVSRGFPSWERARCAPIYVCGREKVEYLPYVEPPQTKPTTCVEAANDPQTPNERPKKSSHRPHLAHTKPVKTPHKALTKPVKTPHLDLIEPVSCPRSLVEDGLKMDCGSLGNHLKPLDTHSTLVNYSIRTQSTLVNSSLVHRVEPNKNQSRKHYEPSITNKG